MGTISTGIGLISGMDIQSLVSQLMEIESQPIRLLEQRVENVKLEQTAFMELNARLLAAKASVNSLPRSSAFTVRSAISSDETSLAVSASGSAPNGSYAFAVRQLASTHRLISNSFADRDFSAIGAGTLTFEPAEASVARQTSLTDLNGFTGISRGTISITDRNGNTAQVDLRMAMDVGDVLDAINSAAGIQVMARVEDDAIVVSDQTSSGTGSLMIKDAAGSFAARDLGIAGEFDVDEDAGRNDSRGLLYMTDNTRLSVLNDGRGVRHDDFFADLGFELGGSGDFEVSLSGNVSDGTNLDLLNGGRGVRADSDGQRIIRITNSNGDTGTVDLTDAQTLLDVQELINGAVADDDAGPAQPLGAG